MQNGLLKRKRFGFEGGKEEKGLSECVTAVAVRGIVQ
jgi:hypothetical protein